MQLITVAAIMQGIKSERGMVVMVKQTQLNYREQRKSALRQSEWYKYIKYRSFVFMFLPVAIFFIVFKYIPVLGNVIAFQNFSIKKGLWGGEWVGLKHFYDLFTTPSFYEVFKNTLVISFSKLLVNFPVPILFAILLNEVLSLIHISEPTRP